MSEQKIALPETKRVRKCATVRVPRNGAAIGQKSGENSSPGDTKTFGKEKLTGKTGRVKGKTTKNNEVVVSGDPQVASTAQKQDDISDKILHALTDNVVENPVPVISICEMKKYIRQNVNKLQ